MKGTPAVLRDRFKRTWRRETAPRVGDQNIHGADTVFNLAAHRFDLLKAGDISKNAACPMSRSRFAIREATRCLIM